MCTRCRQNTCESIWPDAGDPVFCADKDRAGDLDQAPGTAGTQGIIFSFANIIIQSAVNRLGVTAVAILLVTLIVKPSRRYIAGTES